MLETFITVLIIFFKISDSERNGSKQKNGSKMVINSVTTASSVFKKK